jgi:hypothetical protein
MSDSWTSGYVSDIGYTYGYYTELNPSRIKATFAYHGIESPSVGYACELGFGQGLSTNLHSSASNCEWWGTDFNPSQTAFALELSKSFKKNIRLFDDAFEDFCNRPDLPQFDFIGLHGIWSWISDHNRQIITDFIKRKLNVGGVLYVSYNTLPGWAAFAPMRHLMTEHAEVLGSEGRGIVSRIDGALEFAEQLLATNPIFSRANPLVGERLEKMKSQNRHYLAHEYFNRDWHPMHFASMAKWLEPAKLQYACSANYVDAVDTVNLTQEQQKFLREIPDEMFRETVRDFMVNQQFRKDYWIKGKRSMSTLEQGEALRSLRFVLSTPREDVPLKVMGSLGEASLNEDVYNPVLDVLSDHNPKTLGEISGQLKDLNFAQVLQASIILTGAGHLHPVSEEESNSSTKKATTSLNRTIMDRARANGDVQYLASPLTGGGIVVSRFQQLFLLARNLGKKTPDDWAQFAWDLLSAQGQRIVKEGKALETADENIAELRAQAHQFKDRQLRVLSSLGID